MSKEVTKAFILQQMVDKFGLRELEPERFSFSEIVVPTYNVEQHIENWTGAYAQVSITAGPAGYNFLEVPHDERWWLSAYNVIFMAAGAYKVTGLYITRVSGIDIYLDMTLGQTVSYAIELKKLVRLEPGNRVSLYVDNYTSTANLRLYIDYITEKIR